MKVRAAYNIVIRYTKQLRRKPCADGGVIRFLLKSVLKFVEEFHKLIENVQKEIDKLFHLNSLPISCFTLIYYIFKGIVSRNRREI